jgi:LexA-binding, inner membrane-associated putative hydrolase
MPSPVGHILAGAALYLAGTSPQHRSNVTLGVTLMGSVLPDFDFLPGILIGHPAAFHHGVSHSLAFAVLFGAVLFVLLRGHRQKIIATRAALLGALAYAFHIALDAVSAYEAVPILWPLSNVKFGIDLNVFGEFHHERLEKGIWSVVRWDNLPAVTREFTILGTPVVLLFLWRERARVKSTSPVARVKENEYER